MESGKLYLGNAYDLIKSVGDNSVDLVYIDPPYKIVGGGSGGCFGVEHRSYHKQYASVGEAGAENASECKRTLRGVTCPGFDYSILDELERVMKKTNIYIWCSKLQISSLMKYYENKGYNVDLLVWHKVFKRPRILRIC